MNKNECINGTKRTREQMLAECVRLCQNDSNINRLILFGSVAKGTDTEDSDIDLCIDTTYDIHDRGLFLIFTGIEKACGFACDLLIYSYLSGSIKQEVDTNGVVLYGHSV